MANSSFSGRSSLLVEPNKRHWTAKSWALWRSHHSYGGSDKARLYYSYRTRCDKCWQHVHSQVVPKFSL